MEYRFEPIGVIHSCFKEKFGIPRQPGLVPKARATLELFPPYDRDEAVRGLEGFSHVWVIFLFHATADQGWSPTVRPPRLGGNERRGVFATRSPFRPNPIGLSVVTLEKIAREGGKLLLHLGGVDLLDGTPVIDIKPYIPYSDALAEARSGFAPDSPEPRLTVSFSPQADATCASMQGTYPELQELIIDLVSRDPRPAYQREAEGNFGMKLHVFDVKWKVSGSDALVTEIGYVVDVG